MTSNSRNGVTQAPSTPIQERSSPVERPAALSVWTRLRIAGALIAGLRQPDFQAARRYADTRFASMPFVWRWCRFAAWSLRQIFVVIPDAMQQITLAPEVSRTPMWLLDDNPLANHPWSNDPNASLPATVEAVVIGAGFTGAALAYHWSRRAMVDRPMLVLEMDDPASGSSGRNEGLVVMGRYFKYVRDTVAKHLIRARTDLNDELRERLARQFARAYCVAAYRNAELIEQTIRSEGFACGYAREGWIQACDADGQTALRTSVQMANESGFTDWTSIDPDASLQRSGMRLTYDAGFSRGAASWHPAKWVWCLLQAALRQPTVRLFTRTKVMNVENAADHYLVHTPRGVVRARHVVYATESYTPMLYRQLHNLILPMQEQAACGHPGPASMKPHIGISGPWFFAGRYGNRVLFGSGGSVLPDHEAGRNRPSRFLTKFVAGELRRHFGLYSLQLTNEWSGTVGYTPDEFPIVGSLDGPDGRRHIIAGMCGSGSGVSFNAARCICNRILGIMDEPDDYPAEYFAPSRLLDPASHRWPAVEENERNKRDFQRGRGPI